MCPSESHSAMSAAVVSSFSAIPSLPKTSRTTLSSSSSAGIDLLPLSNDLDVRIDDRGLSREVVDPLARPVSPLEAFESEAGEEIAHELVLCSRDIETAKLRASSRRRGRTELLNNAR